MFLIFLAWFNSIVSTSLISIFALTYSGWWDYLWIAPIALGCIIASHLFNFIYFAFFGLIVRVKDDFNEKPSNFYHWLAEECLVFLKYFIGFRIIKEGLEKIPKSGRIVLILNHRSNFDGLICSIVLRGRQISFVSKKEIFDIPIVKGYVYKMGYLKLDRDDIRQNIRAFRKAEEYINKDICSIGICPEGTRNKTEEVLLPFKPGAFKIPLLAKVPVVLVAMTGTDTIGKNFPFKRSTVRFRVIEVLNYDDYKDKSTVEFSEYAESKLKENIKELRELN